MTDRENFEALGDDGRTLVIENVDTYEDFERAMSQIIDHVTIGEKYFICVGAGQYQRARKLVYRYLDQRQLQKMKNWVKIIEEETV
ncbi:MAG: hypothetical protein HQM11_07915 [SAR324 cluster bacterium]|nr:hypothetical protein [SAR324 cluster bacterium]